MDCFFHHSAPLLNRYFLHLAGALHGCNLLFVMRLDKSTTYGWQNMRRSEIPRSQEVRRLSGWTITAIIASLIVHIVFFLTMARMYIPESMRTLSIRMEEPREFTVDRVVLSEAAEEPAPETGDSAEPFAPDNNLDTLEPESLSVLDLQDLIPEDREIAFTPLADEPENVGAPLQAGPNAIDFDDSLADINTDALADSLELMSPAATELPTAEDGNFPQAIDTETLAESLQNEKSALDEMREAAGQSGSALDEYSSLDQLVGLPGSRVTDPSKPIFMPTDLLFDFAEYRLREGARASMMMLGILIDRNPDVTFIIEGHTDTIGSVEFNEKLSLDRANAVRDWLVESLRIDPSRIRTVGYGPARTIANPNGDKDEQSINRRVEIRMIQHDDEIPAEVRGARPINP